MKHVGFLGSLTAVVLLVAAGPAQSQTSTKPPAKQAAPSGQQEYAPPNVTKRQWTGDLDGMIKRRQIRILTAADREVALAVINAAARWYREFLPAEEFHDPEMTPAQWEAEAQRMTWYGAFLGDALVGVMALEYVKDVALLRHAYVLAEHQREGVGTHLREHLEAQVQGVRRIIVGTYRKNYKARKMLERSGYALSPDPEVVLRTYYAIPEDRLNSSITYEKTL